MLCIFELALTIMGIVTLVKGKLSLNKTSAVVGAPAYLAGLILTAVLPLALGIGILIGLTNPPQPGENTLWYVLIDIGVVAFAVVCVGIIYAVSPKEPIEKVVPHGKDGNFSHPYPNQPQQPPQQPPQSSDNPFQSPSGPGNNPFKDN